MTVHVIHMTNDFDYAKGLIWRLRARFPMAADNLSLEAGILRGADWQISFRGNDEKIAELMRKHVDG